MTAEPIPVSPGLWALAWRRLCSDRVAMASLFVLLLFLLTLVLSSTGMVAGDWNEEVGISYAPPSFIGASGSGNADTAAAADPQPPENPLDPLKDVLRELRAEMAGKAAPAAGQASSDYGIRDPLEKELAEIRSNLPESGLQPARTRRDTLPFGADKWGHDIIKKTIKGAETSIIVGLVAALLATFLGTLFGSV